MNVERNGKKNLDHAIDDVMDDEKAAKVTAFALNQLASNETDAVAGRIQAESGGASNGSQLVVDETRRVAELIERSANMDLPDGIMGLEQQIEEAFAQTRTGDEVEGNVLDESSIPPDKTLVRKESAKAAGFWTGRRMLATAATTLLATGGTYLLWRSELPREIASNQVEFRQSEANQSGEPLIEGLPFGDGVAEEATNDLSGDQNFPEVEVLELKDALEAVTEAAGEMQSGLKRADAKSPGTDDSRDNLVRQVVPGWPNLPADKGKAKGLTPANAAGDAFFASGDQNLDIPFTQGNFGETVPAYGGAGNPVKKSSDSSNVNQPSSLYLLNGQTESKVQLPQLAQMNIDSSVAVPDSGTVLLGGIKTGQSSYYSWGPKGIPGTQMGGGQIAGDDAAAVDVFEFDGWRSVRGDGTNIEMVLEAMKGKSQFGDELEIKDLAIAEPGLRSLEDQLLSNLADKEAVTAEIEGVPLEAIEARVAKTSAKVEELKVALGEEHPDVEALVREKVYFEALVTDLQKRDQVGDVLRRAIGLRNQLATNITDGRANRDHALALSQLRGQLLTVVDSADDPAVVAIDREIMRFVARVRDADRVSSNEQYELPPENQFQRPVGDLARSTFSIDVDTASYANMRRFINSGQMPPRKSVRIEEMVNYFSYDYAQPTDGKPFAVDMEVANCPWNESHQLVRIGIKGKEMARDDRPASNLVFLIDVSGSMSDANKLPLLQRSMLMLVDNLTENDRVTVVTYAGNAGLRLPPTSGDQKQKIRDVIDSLSSGGSTHGSAGIQMAYDLASRHFIDEGVNRVILATDGDLNVGVTADDQLVSLIKDKAQLGIFLSVLGFGTGNLKDTKLEKLADNGNGNYSYIDSIREARKVLVEEMTGSLITIAKDVKIQVEFNPAEVAAYRLIGYENRALRNEDFDNDTVDAGEIGAGHTVTAIYELVPVGAETVQPKNETEPLKYQQPVQASETESNDEKVAEQKKKTFELTDAANTGELVTVALRYKQPEASESVRVDYVIEDNERSFDEASEDFRFAASVASYGMLLRGSRHAGTWNLDNIEQVAAATIGDDKQGHRNEFVDLVRQASRLTGK